MTRGIEVIINSIAKHYDFKNRSILLIEEMSELTKAITKYVRVEAGEEDMKKADWYMKKLVELEGNENES